MQTRFNRRQFVATVSAGLAPFCVRRPILGGQGHTPPSEQLRVAVIGTGGQGIFNIRRLLEHPDIRIPAICDVAEFWDNSEVYHRHNGGRGPAMQEMDGWHRRSGSQAPLRCSVFDDYRIMLEKADRDIDAVLIATPNHTHAVACMAAIQAGKGVYCEKPLTHSIYEARRVAQAAKAAGVATQLGNQGHSSDDIRRAVEWLRDGAIGNVREVHAWNGGITKMQLTERPRETPPLPKGLNWDLWLGPARERPFHPAYTPVWFHYWWDFGSGKLGNFGCHTLDTAVWALNLEHPTMVEASSTPLNNETTPAAAMFHYRFPAGNGRPAVDLYWYDGGLMPPRPDCLEANRELPRQGGSLIVGEQGALLSGIWSADPRIIPERRMRAYKQPSASIPRSSGHRRDWINACKGGPPASANFDYGAKLTEIALLGIVALRTGKAIQWDGPNMRATNAPEAEPFIRGFCRGGWTIQ